MKSRKLREYTLGQVSKGGSVIFYNLIFDDEGRLFVREDESFDQDHKTNSIKEIFPPDL